MASLHRGHPWRVRQGGWEVHAALQRQKMDLRDSTPLVPRWKGIAVIPQGTPGPVGNWCARQGSNL